MATESKFMNQQEIDERTNCFGCIEEMGEGEFTITCLMDKDGVPEPKQWTSLKIKWSDKESEDEHWDNSDYLREELLPFVKKYTENDIGRIELESFPDLSALFLKKPDRARNLLAILLKAKQLGWL